MVRPEYAKWHRKTFVKEDFSRKKEILKNNLIKGEGTYHKMHTLTALRNGFRDLEYIKLCKYHH